MNISKIEVTKRQLETAIILFFENGDPVSIHTLIRATHEILETLGKARDIQSVTQWGIKMIKKEKQKEVIAKMNEAKNFFKHANKDFEATLTFNPELSNFYLYDSVRLYRDLTKKFPKLFIIFNVWFFIKYPNILTNEAQKQLFSIPKELDIEDRAMFFQGALNAYNIVNRGRNDAMDFFKNE